MENNLVELKFDRINRFFDELKIKYENEYQNNKITKKINLIRTALKEIFIHLPIGFCLIGIILLIENIFSYTWLGLTDNLVLFSKNGIYGIFQIITEFSLFFIILPFSLIPLRCLLIDIFGAKFEFKQIKKTLSRKKYFSKIRNDMIYYVRWNLSYSIKEDMLIFDKNGLIIGPDLSKKENKRIFNEAERKLESKHG